MGVVKKHNTITVLMEKYVLSFDKVYENRGITIIKRLGSEFRITWLSGYDGFDFIFHVSML